LPNVFVAGDVAYGPKLLIDAVASGKKAARSVQSFLGVPAPAPRIGSLHRELSPYRREKGYEKVRRSKVPVLPTEKRLASQRAIVELGFPEAKARQEASRCFDCGVNPVFDGARCLLCGGCVEVCPESCLKIVSFDRLETGRDLMTLADRLEGRTDDLSAILKDEDLCIRCGLCAERCPNDAITMERFCFGGIPA
ncbi:MAG: 4Fe-4S binding protein, partial [Planctomycetota bacterium]